MKEIKRAIRVQKEWLEMAKNSGADKLVAMLEETIARNELKLKERN